MVFSARLKGEKARSFDVEENVARDARHAVDRQQHRHDHQAQDDVVEIALHHEAGGDRAERAQREDDDHLARAEISPGDGDGARQRHQ